MQIDKLLFISNDRDKIDKLFPFLIKNFEVAAVSFADADEVLASNEDTINVIYDLTDENVERFKQFVATRFRFSEKKFLTLVNSDYYDALDKGGLSHNIWCYNDAAPEELARRILKLKHELFSEKTQNRLIRFSFNKSKFGIALFPSSSLHGAIINSGFLELIGYSEAEYKAGGWNFITHPEDVYLDIKARNKINNGETSLKFEKRIIRKDKKVVWIEEHIDTLPFGNHNEFISIVTIRSIDKHKKLEKKLREMHRSHFTLLNNIPGLAYRCLDDESWTMKFVSAGCEELTGYSADELVENKVISFSNLILRKYHKELRVEWDRIIAQRGIFQYEYEIKTKSNQIKWVYERGVPIFDEVGEFVALEGIVIDITRAKKLEKQLQYMNEFNQKLNLPNREVLKQKIQASLDTKSANGTIFLINLKDTQKLYRSHGYEYVELLTSSLVSKLKSLENEKRELFYVEENMYAFFVKKRYGEDEARMCFRELRQVIEKTIIREQIACNIGVATLNKTSVYAEDFLQRAHVASDFNRDENRLMSFYIYDEETERHVKRENALKQEFIDVSYEPGTGNLRLVFQPLVELKTGRTVGFESLARYTSDVYGPIYPLEFIPLIEKNRLIVAFGKKIIDLAIAFILELNANGFNEIPVSVNISALQLLDSSFVPLLLGKLEESKVQPHLFHIELTESIFSANYDLLNDRINALLEVGIQVGLDDFGTGFSSLSRIEELQFNLVKIDKSFIQRLTPENINLSTIPEIITICQKFNLASLAEGIETKEQYDLLNSLGCKYGQGYFMSRPLEKSDALKFVINERNQK